MRISYLQGFCSLASSCAPHCIESHVLNPDWKVFMPQSFLSAEVSCWQWKRDIMPWSIAWVLSVVRYCLRVAFITLMSEDKMHGRAMALELQCQEWLLTLWQEFLNQILIVVKSAINFHSLFHVLTRVLCTSSILLHNQNLKEKLLSD